MDNAAVLRAAARDGLTLMRADNATGFRGVCRSGRKSKPFKVELNKEYLGYYATAEEAALAYARALGPDGSKAGGGGGGGADAGARVGQT